MDDPEFIDVPMDTSSIELWGQSPHNGVWFPLSVHPLSSLMHEGLEPRQLALKICQAGQMFQFGDIDPSGNLTSTPQFGELEHLTNPPTEGSPA